MIDVGDATKLFDEMPMRNLYSWVAILTLYVGRGLFEEALLLYQELLIEDFGLEFFVFPVVLKIFSGLGGEGLGRQKVFDRMPERYRVSWNSVVTACAADGMVYEALFLEKMSDESTPNLVSWCAVIGGFSQNGYDEEAILTMSRMQAACFELNAQTLASVLPACASLKTIERGKQVHAYAIKSGYESDVHIGAAIVDMYAKCGNITHASMASNRISNPNLVSQNAMLAAYALCGRGEEGIAFFRRMLLDGFKPDGVTFLSVLSSCVHAGSVQRQREFFNLMGYCNVEHVKTLHVYGRPP
ncbi:tetratricopeptide repeat (TPR)-like superfamily protein [Actinidia rufa]|uniref:Tetratricopeptide repeat (TPR)-like superfamily protein n=1 Tax=Actinidia rufa TaxID=165716 RepID=A0A7J0EAC3_9ERIC|nr:tetratricopeptide repeat (TPR)-like superfamily protein [Actinidia rufa]